jgi:hypothetical protein
MTEVAPVLATASSTPAKKLDKAEKGVAGILMVLGIVLIAGILVWFAASTKDGSLLAKEIATTEQNGQKTITEKNYADGVVTLALTLGAVLILSGAFFGRIREIKFAGGTVLSMEAPEEVAEEAKKTAEDRAKAKAPTGKEEEAAAIAGSLAKQQIGLAYATAPSGARPVIAEAVGAACAKTAVKAVEG